MPDDSQRILIVGRTGGGKSMEALHHLSQRSFHERPWIIIDFKGDFPVNAVPTSAPPATVHDAPPDSPGLYVARAEIDDQGQGGAVSDYLIAVYEQGNTGIMIDEGLMLGLHNRGLRMLLTQGRSRSCPLIILCQRPAYLDLYAFSESEYIQTFYLQLKDDQVKMNSFVPEDRLNFAELRARGLYHSAYYDVRADELENLSPCPEFQAIYDRILTRLPVYADSAPEFRPRRVRI